MPSPSVDIPLSWPSEPGELRRALERFSNSLDRFLRGLALGELGRVLPRYNVAPNQTTLAYETLTTVAPAESDEIFLQLPRPTLADGGRALEVARNTTTGRVHLVPKGCLVNGATDLVLLSAIGLYVVRFDGTNFFTTPHAINWTEVVDLT